jgi:regulator of RNase E activity RraA
MTCCTPDAIVPDNDAQCCSGYLRQRRKDIVLSQDIAIDKSTLDALSRASTATISTQLFQRGLRNTFLNGVRPLNPAHARFVGEALTLRSIPAREDLDKIDVFRNPDHPQRKAIETVGPGQVLVFECRGDLRAANAGGILVTRARMRGAAAIVSDGAIRDSPEIEQMPFPVFVAGRSATISLAVHHAVDINVPIGCAGVAVYPGDILVGDEEGVVVIPRYLAAEIAQPAADQEELERFIMERIESGAALPGTYPPNDETRAAFEAWRKG